MRSPSPGARACAPSSRSWLVACLAWAFSLMPGVMVPLGSGVSAGPLSGAPCVGLSVAGEKAVALHLGKPLRQHVHEELALELDGIELHGHVAVVMRVAVANATLSPAIETCESEVRDGHAVGVTAEVPQLLSASPRDCSRWATLSLGHVGLTMERMMPSSEQPPSSCALSHHGLLIVVNTLPRASCVGAIASCFVVSDGGQPVQV